MYAKSFCSLHRSGSGGHPLLLLILLLAITWAPVPNAAARLPKPTKYSGTVIAVDIETQTIVFKEGPKKKPFLLEWNKTTEFVENGRPAFPATLTPGTRLNIEFKHVSFRKPLLLRVEWGATGPAS